MLQSKKILTFVPVLTALIFSRGLFAFFNDLEGPNVLIVLIAGVAVYFFSFEILSLFSVSKQEGLKKTSVFIFIQLLVVIIFYLLLY